MQRAVILTGWHTLVDGRIVSGHRTCYQHCSARLDSLIAGVLTQAFSKHRLPKWNRVLFGLVRNKVSIGITFLLCTIRYKISLLKMAYPFSFQLSWYIYFNIKSNRFLFYAILCKEWLIDRVYWHLPRLGALVNISNNRNNENRVFTAI